MDPETVEKIEKLQEELLMIETGQMQFDESPKNPAANWIIRHEQIQDLIKE